MSSIVTVPLIAKPQTLVVSLGGVVYNLTCRWNRVSQSWTLDIADSAANPLINGIPLITGADLLAQYAYKGIGGKLIVQSSDNPDAVPTFTNLGANGNLYFVSP